MCTNFMQYAQVLALFSQILSSTCMNHLLSLLFMCTPFESSMTIADSTTDDVKYYIES